MKDILVAMPQINPTVGALANNTEAVAAAAARAAASGAEIIVFPELVLSGYPPEDLVLKPHFLEDCAAQCRRLEGDLPATAITLIGSPWREGQRISNAALVYAGGRRRAVYRKRHLPNYGVFDEKRLFSPGRRALLIEAFGARLAIHICEDTWCLSIAEARALRDMRPDALLNLSASPFDRGKLSRREEVLRKAALSLNTHVVYCNLVGGQDELVFDGASMVLNPEGSLVARSARFTTDTLFFRLPIQKRTPPRDGKKHIDTKIVVLEEPERRKNSLPVGRARIAPAPAGCEEIYGALCLGLKDYVEKNGFKKTLVAVSGGIDSALVAALAVDALGAQRVEALTLPSPFTSADTLADARALASRLNIRLHEAPIHTLYHAFLDILRPCWPGRAEDTAEENLQARIRGTMAMALSNKFGWLVLASGNKSELAMGYCTLYGDMVGGLAVLKDVPKTMVFELAAWLNARTSPPLIPQSILTRPPSAELRPDQKDTDSLPPYEILDGIIEHYVEQEQGVEQIVARGFDPETVRRVVQQIDLSEYKRRQGAPGIKISPKVFGRDRRMPITNRYGDFS